MATSAATIKLELNAYQWAPVHSMKWKIQEPVEKMRSFSKRRAILLFVRNQLVTVLHIRLGEKGAALGFGCLVRQKVYSALFFQTAHLALSEVFVSARMVTFGATMKLELIVFQGVYVHD